MDDTAGARLLLHPVRMRVVEAFLGGRRRTIAELRRLLPDVPVATLYRHVGRLADAGVLEVVDERPVRGSLERTYELHESRAHVRADAAGRMSADEHRRAFAVFVAGLVAGFDRHLAGGGHPAEDLVGYRRAAFWLTDDELAHLVDDLRKALAPYREHGPGDGRRLRHLATVLFPDAPERTP